MARGKGYNADVDLRSEDDDELMRLARAFYETAIAGERERRRLEGQRFSNRRAGVATPVADIVEEQEIRLATNRARQAAQLAERELADRKNERRAADKKTMEVDKHRERKKKEAAKNRVEKENETRKGEAARWSMIMDGIRGVGSLGGSLAKNNIAGSAIGGLEKVGGTLTKMSGMIGKVNPKLGAMAGAAGSAASAAAGAAGAMLQLIQSVNARAEELKKWNGSLMQASVREKILGMQADMREAKQLGPSMARLRNASTDVWIEIRDLLLPVKKVIVDRLAIGVERISAILQSVSLLLTKIEEMAKKFGDNIWNMLPKEIKDKISKAMKIAEDVQRTVDQFFGVNKKQGSIDDFQRMLDRALGGLNGRPAAVGPQDPNPDVGRLFLPGLQF
jgi:hypothetical protein